MHVRACLALSLSLAAAPALAHGAAAEARLLVAGLTLAPGSRATGAGGADLRLHPGRLVAAADAPAPAPADAATGALDFDLLGAGPDAARADPNADAEARTLKRRRKLLEWHQGVGLALVAAELGTTVAGQLSYQDKFAGTAPANTNRYRMTHALFAASTLGLFAANGVLALLTPAPPGRKLQLDRVMVHRISMALAAAGMIAQAYYGFHTSGREGYLDQARIARTHLAIGYATLGAITIGVGAIAF